MRLNTYLINYYNCSQSSLDIKFPHLPNKAFINLAVIEKESVNRADADSFTKGTLHGHADEILKKKKPIDLDAVLEPPEGCQRLKCVFVEGAPGVGKSTFALELCRRKDKIKSLKRFSLAILLRLREKEVQEIKNVSELFYFSDPNLQQSVTKEVVSCGGENVLFVLDGFDEFPDDLRRQSFLVELIQGKHLPACTVLVTSRPSATSGLYIVRNRMIDKYMEILGFTHNCIKQYAESMLAEQPDVYGDFLKYIAKNPTIYGMMYIPLNSAIVVEIYKAKRVASKPVPLTLTQLYTQLCFVLLRKYLDEKGDPLDEELSDNFTDLPKSLKEQLFKLGKLAFEGALKGEIAFNKLPDGCEGLGFMNVSTSLYLGRKSVLSRSFLHLTLQEFLGALYVSQLQEIEQKLLIIEKFVLWINNERCSDVMLRFIAGLTELKQVGWELAHRPMLCDFDCKPFYIPLLVRCLLEIHDTQKIRNSCDIIRDGRDRYIFTITTDTPFDYYAIGYCVAASGSVWNIDPSLNGGDEVVEMLGSGLQSVEDVSGFISRLDLSNNALTHEAMISLSNFPQDILSWVHTLDLTNNRLTKTALDILADSITLMHSLHDLNLSKNPAGEGGMEKMFLNLPHIKSLHSLNVLDMGLGSSDIQALSSLLQPDAYLKELFISVEDIPCAIVIDTIFSESSLTKVELHKLKCTAEGANKFQVLESNRNLTILTFGHCVGLNMALLHIANALHKNVSLKELYFRVNSDAKNDTVGLETDGVLALSEMVRVNSTLQKLESVYVLNNINITSLNDAMNNNETLNLSVKNLESGRSVEYSIFKTRSDSLFRSLIL